MSRSGFRGGAPPREEEGCTSTRRSSCVSSSSASSSVTAVLFSFVKPPTNAAATSCSGDLNSYSDGNEDPRGSTTFAAAGGETATASERFIARFGAFTDGGVRSMGDDRSSGVASVFGGGGGGDGGVA
eukprot:30931-Pelagococcus_subviridis.AAC.2